MINSYPESSPTPSHLPKPRMRNIIFNKDICLYYLWTTLRHNYFWTVSDDLLVDNPPMYINWADSDDWYFIWTTLRCISIGPTPTIDILYGLPSDNYYYLVNPPKPFSLESPHALTPIFLGFPSAYGNA